MSFQFGTSRSAAWFAAERIAGRGDAGVDRRAKVLPAQTVVEREAVQGPGVLGKDAKVRVQMFRGGREAYFESAHQPASQNEVVGGRVHRVAAVPLCQMPLGPAVVEEGAELIVQADLYSMCSR